MSQHQVLAGFHAVTARVRHAPQTIRAVYVDMQRRDKRMQSLIDRMKLAGLKIQTVSAERLDELAAGVRHQGVVAMANTMALAQTVDELFDEIDGVPFLLILDGVTDPHNLGACLRTANAAGVHAVIAPRDRSAGLTAVARRVACGAAESTPYILVTNLARCLRDLKARGVWIVGTDERGEQTPSEVDLKTPIAWVMGAEGEGMRHLTSQLCDMLVRIPMAGSVESLNVSVATGVCLFETVRQRLST
ncbi:23S rRNA (guanosine(2251)-2'-O)-methyltransferase RlmB [Orrella sp. 11846]|uniref:23S rRNA (guanosine(2251)-2'-O)-methyltransferase RlmB n=1 Tax=Orrella sp. 11846 TaxID=3409913 RepID=UPI003B597FE4